MLINFYGAGYLSQSITENFENHDLRDIDYIVFKIRGTTLHNYFMTINRIKTGGGHITLKATGRTQHFLYGFWLLAKWLPIPPCPHVLMSHPYLQENVSSSVTPFQLLFKTLKWVPLSPYRCSSIIIILFCLVHNSSGIYCQNPTQLNSKATSVGVIHSSQVFHHPTTHKLFSHF